MAWQPSQPLPALASVDAAITRIEMDHGGLRAISLTSRARYARQHIEGVTWASGSGVALKLANGVWAKLPELGRNSQSITNSVRAWLKRTADHGPSNVG